MATTSTNLPSDAVAHGEEHDGSKNDGYAIHAHVSETRDNRVILALLFVLTGLTVACYRVRLGDANLMVALLIAAVKATLVGTFFMHLKFEKAFNTLVFVGTLAFIGVFFIFTWNDTAFRGEIDHRSGEHYDYRYNEFAQGVATGIRERGGEELRPVPGAAGEHGASAEAEGGAEHGAPAGH
jgi:cytochrome c oxidase subunit 4